MLRRPTVTAAPAASARVVPEPVPDAPTVLAPSGAERLRRLCADLRGGLPVIVEDRGEATLVALIESLSEARYRALSTSGEAELALTRRRADALGLGAPAGGEAVRLPVPGDATLSRITALAGRDAHGPDGTTAASLPALRPATPIQRAALDLARATQAVPAVLTAPLAAVARHDGLTTLRLDMLTDALQRPRPHHPVGSARLPMHVGAAGRVHVFRSEDGGTEHCAVEIGTPDRARPVSVRLHSACFTGDVLGSLKCDCGAQLRAAMATMARSGGGVLLYLDQEGRGIGLANKMRAYALQDAGLDTVDANHRLGFEDDERDFGIGAQLLAALGIGRVRLLTNNPAKVEILSSRGIDVVERVPLVVGRTTENAGYLATKAAKSRHVL